MGSLKAYRLRFFGRVQRLGFRGYALDLAQELGLTGCVKNLADGSVELFVQGEGAPLAKFLEAVKKPPQPILVRRVEEEEASPSPDFKEFKVVYGELAEELQEGLEPCSPYSWTIGRSLGSSQRGLMKTSS